MEKFGIEGKDFKKSKKVDGVEFDENSEYIIIKIGEKKRYIPKRKYIQVNGRMINTINLIEAMTVFPDDDPSDALEKMYGIKGIK